MEDKKEAKRVQIKVARYTMMGNKLYQKSWDRPMLKRYLPEREELEVMKQIHKGICDNHAGRRSLAHKAMIQGYFRQKMLRDADQLVQKYDNC